MDNNFSPLHSHSGIEREQDIPKHLVIIDKCYRNLFNEDLVKLKPYTYRGKEYLLCPTYEFVKASGVFKNFSR